MLRAGVSRGIERGTSGVDRENGVINGFSVITKGEARGHNMLIDDTTLDQVVEHGNRSHVGLKSRFGHPNMSSDALGTFLGRATNFRRDGDQVRADLKMDESAYKTPNGDLAGYVLGLGETDPAAFATSIVFSGKREPQEGDDEDAMPLARVEKLYAVDVVDEGAANSGMFGSQFFTGSVELSAAGTKALNALLDQPEAVDKILAFLERFSARREGHSPAEALEKEPEMANPTEAPAVTAEQLEKVNAELAAAKAESRKLAAETSQEAVKAERQRIAAIRKAAFAGQDELVNKAIEEGLSVEQAMTSFIEAEKLSNKKRLDELRKDPVPKLGPNADSNAPDDVKDVELESAEYDEAKLTARWEKDAALRSEFMGNKVNFLAYCKAASNGRLKKQIAN